MGYCFCPVLLPLPSAHVVCAMGNGFCPELLPLPWAIAYALGYRLCTLLIWHFPGLVLPLPRATIAFAWVRIAFALADGISFAFCDCDWPRTLMIACALGYCLIPSLLPVNM